MLLIGASLFVGSISLKPVPTVLDLGDHAGINAQTNVLILKMLILLEEKSRKLGNVEKT